MLNLIETKNTIVFDQYISSALFYNSLLLNEIRENVRMYDYASWWTYINQQSKYKNFNKILNKKIKKNKQKIQQKHTINKQTNKNRQMK